MLLLIEAKSCAVAVHDEGLVENPSMGGGPVVLAITGSACVGPVFKFPAFGGGCEKSMDEINDERFRESI